jgi:hypothetical protein
VIALVGLTAWDSQRIKDLYFESDGREPCVGARLLARSHSISTPTPFFCSYGSKTAPRGKVRNKGQIEQPRQNSPERIAG